MTLRLVTGICDGAAVVRRLERLRRQLADLADPRLVQIDAIGLTHNGRPVVAGEHVAGVTLLQHAGRVTDVSRRVRLLDSVADALARAHRAAIVHGRLRWSNVLVTQDRSGPVPRLLDAGLTQAIAGGELDPAADLASLDELRRQVLAL